MRTGQKGVCVRDKGLSLGQSLWVLVSPAAHCSRALYLLAADFCGLMLGRSRVKFQKFARAVRAKARAQCAGAANVLTQRSWIVVNLPNIF